MLTVFIYNNPGWGVPCISPFVTKTLYYLTMTGIPFRLERQNLLSLQVGAPNTKLPYIIDEDGTKVADSTEITRYLKRIYGDSLDETASASERAVMHAWNRLIDEHLYWQWPLGRVGRTTRTSICMAPASLASIRCLPTSKR